MKKIILFVFIGLFSFNVYGQNNAINKHFSKYQRDTSFTKVTVTSRMFSLFTEIEAEDEEEEEILAAMSKLKGIKAIIKNNPENSKNLYYDAVDIIQNDGTYEELMTVEDAGENMQFMIRDGGKKIEELMMVIGGNKQFMVMTLYGEIDLNSIAKISRVLKIQGMEAFQALEKEDTKKNKK